MCCPDSIAASSRKSPCSRRAAGQRPALNLPRVRRTLTEKAANVLQAVQQLRNFRRYLEHTCVRQTFTNPDDLAKNVAISLANLAQRYNNLSTSTSKIWQPLFCHGLQPARHFRGRESKLHEVKQWLQSPTTDACVLSLVAAGGTGKTALVQEALRQTTLSNRSGLLVWSFYEDARMDAFLFAAYIYFTGDADVPTGGILERLQLALSGDAPHTLILDGIERMQSAGGQRRRGEIEDFQLKRLMRAFASGVGNARVLVTSRFQLVDLDSWIGTGHREVLLDDLERPAALDVMRAWGTNGTDETLTRVLQPFDVDGRYHALSVAVLGSYIGNIAHGDPKGAPTFSLFDVQEIDPKARRLNSILEQYAAALSAVERDLLARLTLFPRGVTSEPLEWIAQSAEDVAGALVGLPSRQVTEHLIRLRALGLVYAYESDRQLIWSAHPFLREFFRGLLRIRPEYVHEAVRNKLSERLRDQPQTPVQEVTALDALELLIEQTLLSGRAQEAFDLYRHRLGGYENLGWVLGENIRGRRILEQFVPGLHETAQSDLRDPLDLFSELGAFAEDQGDLGSARESFIRALDVQDLGLRSVMARNLADVELNAGRFPAAIEHSEMALALASESADMKGIRNALGFRATANFAIGNIDFAAADFQRATEVFRKPLHSVWGILEAECKMLRGDWTGALEQTKLNRDLAIENRWFAVLCRCDALIAQLLSRDDHVGALKHLQNAHSFATRTGYVELQLRCFRAAPDVYHLLGDDGKSIADAEAGILLADACGFGVFSIDLRLALAGVHLAIGNFHEAVKYAGDATALSADPECRYAWGEANGLHISGMTYSRLGERELARQQLASALRIQEFLGHPGVRQTRQMLES